MAMPVVPLPTFTVDQVRAFPPDGCRYELVNGVLLVTPAPANVHQVVLSRIGSAVTSYLGNDGVAVAVSPGEIELRPSVHLEPDLLVYPSRFGPTVDWTEITDWWLAVEVSGRASRIYDRDFKRDAYLALGVLEVWLVDLVDQLVLVSRAGAPKDVPHRDELVWHPPEMPALLTIDLRTIFAGLG